MTKQGIIFIVVILTAATGGIYILFEHIKKMGYESCVLSIEDAFGQAISYDPEISREVLVTNEWRTLDEREERILFDKFIAFGRTFDCKQFDEYANGEALRGEKGSIKVLRDGKWVRVRIEADDGRTRRVAMP